MDERWVEAEGIDVETVMAEIRRRIEEKREKRVYTQEEIRAIEHVDLLPLPDILDVPHLYDPEEMEKHLGTLSFGTVRDLPMEFPLPPSGIKGKIKRVLYRLGHKLAPVINILTLYRLADLNFRTEKLVYTLEDNVRASLQIHTTYREHLKIVYNLFFHMTGETTKLKIENDSLRVKLKELENRLQFLEERERVLERSLEKRG